MYFHVNQRGVIRFCPHSRLVESNRFDQCIDLTTPSSADTNNDQFFQSTSASHVVEFAVL